MISFNSVANKKNNIHGYFAKLFCFLTVIYCIILKFASAKHFTFPSLSFSL